MNQDPSKLEEWLRSACPTSAEGIIREFEKQNGGAESGESRSESAVEREDEHNDLDPSVDESQDDDVAVQ